MRRHALPVLILVVLASFLVAACGGGDGEAGDTAATTQPRATASTPARGGDGGEGQRQDHDNGAAAAGSGGGGQRAGAEAAGTVSLTTDPKTIPGARVTPTGAVQTLPANKEDQAEATENSYSSIKNFGAEAEGSEATDITFALTQYLSARVTGDWATACARLYTPLRDNLAKSAGGPALESGGCAEAYGLLMSRTPRPTRVEAAKIDVASIRREGNRAFVIYKTPVTLSADMPLYLDGGVWTVASLDPYVLTQEQLEENK